MDNLIYNCPITQEDSEVLQNYETYPDEPGYENLYQYSPWVDITGHTAYTMYSGLVVYVENTYSEKTVIVQTGDNFCVSYGHLSSILVEDGTNLGVLYTIGKFDDYLRLELLTKTESKWPVRIGNETWYKDDPYKLLYGSMQNDTQAGYEETLRTVRRDNSEVNLTSVASSILMNGFGG